MSVFEFKARWKEELVCTGPHGSFVLELAMGRLTAYLSPKRHSEAAPLRVRPISGLSSETNLNCGARPIRQRWSWIPRPGSTD